MLHLRQNLTISVEGFFPLMLDMLRRLYKMTSMSTFAHHLNPCLDDSMLRRGLSYQSFLTAFPSVANFAASVSSPLDATPVLLSMYTTTLSGEGLPGTTFLALTAPKSICPQETADFLRLHRRES